jgi:predicted nucleic acid-binding protein
LAARLPQDRVKAAAATTDGAWAYVAAYETWLRKAALKLISRTAHILRPTAKVSVLRDLPDNRILECAAEAQADLVVTGDRHMLKLKEFQASRILRLTDFLRPLPSEE